MNAAFTGAVLGAVAGLGLALVLVGLPLARRPRLADRVLPYVRDLLPDGAPVASGAYRRRSGTATTVLEVFGPTLRGAADLVGRVLGGGADLRRRLQRAGSALTVEQFRVEQVLWGLAASMGTAARRTAGSAARIAVPAAVAGRGRRRVRGRACWPATSGCRRRSASGNG